VSWYRVNRHSPDKRYLMPAIVWQHNVGRDVARQLLKTRIEHSGVGDKVQWDGYQFSASVGWGVVLDLLGEVDDASVILQKCSGAIGSVVLSQTREAFQELFPGGEVLQNSPTSASTQ
jgi:hypothetical protein